MQNIRIFYIYTFAIIITRTETKQAHTQDAANLKEL